MTLLAVCLLTPSLGSLPAQADDGPSSARVSAVSDSAPTASQVAAALKGAGDKVARTASSADALSIAPLDPQAGVSLGTDTLRVGIPHAKSASPGVVVNGVTIYRNEAHDSAVAVNPTPAGSQLLVTVGASSAPTRYRFPVDAPAGTTVELTDDGGAQILRPDGELAAVLPAPWAVDASGKPVPTQFLLDGNTLVQEINHTTPGTTYPVVADPEFYRCDAWTSTCVLFSRSETRRLASMAGAGTALHVFVTGLCALAGNPAGIAACAATVALVADSLKRAFRRAAREGKCMELHFLGAAGTLWKWKAKTCR
ncbi:MAG: hypothetical protein ACI379_16220 [Nocardioides sp.]|uniref:hypothetical protein n=1 Tax=Nocardioides sp. TaxID=35761 RepID=UPI003F0F32B3